MSHVPSDVPSDVELSIREEFFDDVRPTDLGPIPCHQHVNSAPDVPLRQLGVIRMKGRLRTNMVEFDPRMPKHHEDGEAGDIVNLLHDGNLGAWVISRSKGLPKERLSQEVLEEIARDLKEARERQKQARERRRQDEQLTAAAAPEVAAPDPAAGAQGGQVREVPRLNEAELAASAERSFREDTEHAEAEAASGATPRAEQDEAEQQLAEARDRAIEHETNIGSQLENRTDTQPGAVIRIVGSLSYRDFSASLEKKRTMERRRIASELRGLPMMKDDLPSLKYAELDFDAINPTARARRASQQAGGSGHLGLHAPNQMVVSGSKLLAGTVRRRSSMAQIKFSELFAGQKTGRRPKSSEGAGARLLAEFEMRCRRRIQGATAYEKFATTGFKELINHDTSSSSADDAPMSRQPPADRPDEVRRWRRKLRPHQTVKYVRQYLQRSIPTAADSLRAIVICNEPLQLRQVDNSRVKPGDIAQSLNKGFFGIGETQSAKDAGVASVERRKQGSYVSRGGGAPAASLLGMAALPAPAGRHEKSTEEWEETIKRTVHSCCKQLGNFTHLLFLWGERGPATRKAVTDYTNALVDSLARGSVRDWTLDPSVPQPPERAGAQVCTILVGGDDGQAQLELMRSVANKWPILVVEGSLGYADKIAQHIHSVEDFVGAPSIDDYRRFLGKIDPNTRTIICSGLVSLIAKGTPADQVQRLIQQSLLPDATLHMAWLKYATWDHNAWFCRKLFIAWQFVILLTGILAIALSILLTFLQLQFPEDTGVTTRKPQTSLVARVYSYLGIVVVILPVGLSLFEAIQNKLNAGGRWVDLRSASETMLREIYMFRTQTGRYALDKIAESQHKRGNDESNKGGQTEDDDAAMTKQAWERKDKEMAKRDQIAADQYGRRGDIKAYESFAATDSRGAYKTRQEKLNFWIEHLVDHLKDGAPAQSTLRAYHGPLPPIHILQAGDDGWKDITPDEYVAYRLVPLQKRYEVASSVYETRLKYLNLSNYVLGAVGTMLAALSSLPFLTEYNLQAWVALTTGCSNALTRYIDYSRLEFLQKKGSDVSLKLTNVQSWWEGRSSDADGQNVRDNLVHQVEELITGECIEWGGQMKKAMERQKKDKKEREQETKELTQKLKAGEDLEQVRRMQELGLDSLNSKNLAAALQNPTGPEAQKVMESMQLLNDTVEETVGVNMKDEILKTEIAKEAARKAEAIKQTAEQFLDEGGNLLDVNLGGISLSDFVPAELVSVVKDPKARKKMFANIRDLDLSSLSRDKCLDMLKSAGEKMAQHVGEMTQRQMLECLKSAAVNQLSQQLTEALSSIKVSVFELVPRKDMVEVLLMELRDVNNMKWREMSQEEICLLFKDAQIRNKMSALHEVTLRGILKRAGRIVGANESKIAGLLYTTLKRIAQLDTAELFSETHVEAEMFDMVDRLTDSKLAVDFLSKDEILQRLPTFVRELETVKNKSQAQLAEYVRNVQQEFNVSRIFASYSRQMKQNFLELGGLGDAGKYLGSAVKQFYNPGNDPVMESLAKNKKLCDRFVYATRSVGQKDINKMDRNALVKKLQTSPALSLEMVEELRHLKRETLMHVMSGVKGSISNTQSGRVFDQLCDEVASVDLRELLPGPDERQKFIDRIEEFKGSDLTQKTKQEIITTLAYRPLVSSALKLSENQLREVVGRALGLMGSGFHASIFSRVVKTFGTELDPVLDFYPGEKDAPVHVPIKDVTKQLLGESYRQQLKGLSATTVDRICTGLATCRRKLELSITNPALKGTKLLAALRTQKDVPEVMALLQQETHALLADNSVLAVFKDWHTADVWVLLRQVRSAMGERVLSLVFEGVSRDLLMIDPQCHAKFRAFFFRPLTRKLMLQALIALVSSKKGGMSELQKMSQDEILEEMVPTYVAASQVGTPGEGFEKQHLEAFRNVLAQVFRTTTGGVKRLLLEVLSELVVTVPYHMFLKLAIQLSSFDLRELIDDPRSRRLLPILVFRCYIAREGDSCILQHSGGQKRLKSAKGILDAMDSLGDYNPVVNSLRTLTKEQLLRLVSAFCLQFETQVGRFFEAAFKAVRAREKAQIGLSYDVLTVAVSSVKSQMQIAPLAVARDLRNFDAKEFGTVYTEEQRLAILRRFVTDEDCAVTIAQSTPLAIEQFFAHLRAIPYATASEAELSAAKAAVNSGHHQWSAAVLHEVQATVNELIAAVPVPA
eukprot:TRINITY_DN12056_c0_g1_i3.p1 TRINITY_DN12056_c0_g1~~TRINITY_DN12056_c0_g1_i3.p1  ORF type:complete len:2227 (+),score=814.21 TRINITY_DN12056_c0_g1_i3:94-6681(+)